MFSAQYSYSCNHFPPIGNLDRVIAGVVNGRVESTLAVERELFEKEENEYFMEGYFDIWGLLSIDGFEDYMNCPT